MNDLLNDVATRAGRYLDGLGERPVVPDRQALDALARLGGPLPRAGRPAAEVVRRLDEWAGPATVASAGPRYFGFVTGGALPAALAANWLAAAWDQNAFSTVSSPLAAAIEEIALAWVIEALGLPSNTGGSFVTGATMANFAGLAAARHAVLEQAGWQVEEDGLFGSPPITVVVGNEAHTSLLKALSLLGLGRKRVLRVPADEEGRMRPEAFPSLEGPAIVCLQAGNVNTGAFDPAEELIGLAHGFGAWVHVDGAFGLWAAAAPQRAHLTKGYDQADSWALDAHKWLNVPYDCGCALVRAPRHLQAAMSVKAAYLMQGTERDPFDFTPECSRRMRGLEVWAALMHLGRDGLADLIERTCRLAERFAEGLAAAGFAVLNDPVLNQVLVSFGDRETTQRVIEAVQSNGTCWCGGTEWHGKSAMRISVSSWATREEDVDRSLEAIRRAACEVGR
ncbi:MAG TPA: aminotransferase class V-fold PLP-dependent enzyme [Kiloniellales bacterium]